MNGDRIDSLLENDRQQTHVLDSMEDRFQRVSSIMDELFHNRFFNRELLDPFHFSSFGSSQRRPFPKTRFARNIMSFPMFGVSNIHDMFQPFFDMIHQAQQAMDGQFQGSLFDFPMVEFPEGEKDVSFLLRRDGNSNLLKNPFDAKNLACVFSPQHSCKGDIHPF